MTNAQKIQPRDADQPTRSAGYDRSLKVAGNSEFQVEVRRRIDEFFQKTGRRQRDCPQMYAKTAILLAAFVASYGLLVFVAETWGQVLPLAVGLGLIPAANRFYV